jgi:O-methyltransferase
MLGMIREAAQTSTPRRVALRAGAWVWHALRLGWLLERVERRLPERIVHWVKMKRAVARRQIAPTEDPTDRPLVPERELEQKYREALALLLEHRSAEDLGAYMEFGVYIGRSLSCMHRALSHHGIDNVHMFGFDSIEGLPRSFSVEELEAWEPGQFSVDLDTTRQFLERRGVDMERVSLIKGWFDETLTLRLSKTIRKASMIMVDCDLYASAKTALNFSAHLIVDEAVLFFDDWDDGGLATKRLGERRAFEEFQSANPALSVSELESYSENSRAFLITRSSPAPPVSEGQDPTTNSTAAGAGALDACRCARHRSSSVRETKTALDATGDLGDSLALTERDTKAFGWLPGPYDEETSLRS